MARSDTIIASALQQFEAGLPEQAKGTLRAFVQRFPGDAPALKTLAMIHGALKEDREALAAIARAAAVEPRNPELRFMHANVLMILKKYKESAEEYRAVIKLAPGAAAAYDALARCLLSLGDFSGAMTQYERSIEVAPDDEDVYKRIGTTLSIIGRIDESLAATKRGLARLPGSAALQEQLCYNANFADGVDSVWLKEQHARLGAMTAAGVGGRGARPIVRDRSPERPLRVAFLSADFVLHACAFFLEGLLRELDRSRVRAYLYYTREAVDAWTPRFHALGEWRHVPGIPPEEFARLTEEDQIDIVIDCGGWTDQGHMKLLTPRVAPVQATWLGYPNTTGMPTVDYRIVDAHTDPAGAEAHATERLCRLPGCFLSFRPMEGAPDPAKVPAPHQANPEGGIVFGSFNRVTKVGKRAIQVWARVLKETPGSKLLIKAQIAFEEVQRQFVAHMGEHGIGPERILIAEFVEQIGAHLPMYRRLDIALDSFPYNGTTTTCEAAWMGVPVVVLAGDSHRSRVGVSLQHAIGTPELIAKDEDDYVRIAAELARDRTRLTQYHATLRTRMAGSMLCDYAGYARKFESALREMWHAYVRGEVGARGGTG